MRVDSAFNPYVRRSAPAIAGPASAGRARAGQAPEEPAGAREPRHRDPAGPDRLEALTAEERRLIQSLRNRDREVRAHELAHQSVGGQYAGAPSYSYTEGPDGRRYATGGEVDISLRRTGDPAQDLRMAETVRRAALAPAEPSAQDQRVAARAAAIAAEAREALQNEGGAGVGAAEASRDGGRRRLEGEYIDRVSIRREPETRAADSPFARRFAQVQSMGAPELMAVGGRLDMFA